MGTRILLLLFIILLDVVIIRTNLDTKKLQKYTSVDISIDRNKFSPLHYKILESQKN